DTYRGDPRDPLSLNLYAYCANNPITYYDPTGFLRVKIDDREISDVLLVGDTVYGNIYDLAMTLDYNIIENNESIALYYIDYTGAKRSREFTKKGWLKNNENMIAGVRELAEYRGYGDTISWWHDANKNLNVLVRPEMKYAPIQVKREGGEFKINAKVRFTGDANELFEDTGKTYAELAAKGIEEHWTTSFVGSEYDFYEGFEGNVVTNVSYMVPGQSYFVNSNQRYLNINIDLIDPPKKRVPSTMSGGGRRWSVVSPGSINIVHYDNKYPNMLKGHKYVAAHEFGHTLGLSDAYERPSSEAAEVTAEVPRNDIMRRHRGTVNANTIEMVWEAWSTNQWQYFDGHNRYPASRVIKFSQ
ncbi:hypothetical protein RBH29_17515, partial [Herbivorax sp. ANBcel31]|uniref:hypothetical protein n=1 Tax=Herbivorax sp. ANBcel31 TaxID=3069754 RepID=UPI0027B62C76